MSHPDVSHETKMLTTLQNTGHGSTSRISAKRNNSGGSLRVPLSSVTVNRREPHDQSMSTRVTHSRVEELGQHSNGVSRSGSEADSLLDLYQHGKQPKARQSNYDNEVPENMYKPRDEDPEGWIHRDKLAKIESEELQAAGINLASRRGRSKSGRRDTSRSRKSEESSHSTTNERREEKKPRLSEPVEEERDDDRTTWDFRSPEEIAQETAAGQIYSQPTLRKSGSRIPVMTSSPHPIPVERLDRDTPLPRKRTMSNSMSPDDGLSVNKARRRGSNASQDGIDASWTPTSTPGVTSRPGSKPGSPAKKEKTPPLSSSMRKATPNSVRKPSGQTKNGPLSPTGSVSQRPGTRSGELDRPKTAVNRPEGDPPWLATMYKPDPRLPPDQQIIPTHARRQQQAQWADDGSVPKTYDRDFTPLAVHKPEELEKRLSSTPASPVGEKPQDNTWPLKPMSSVRSAASGRPGTSGSITGGYSTMPKVQPSPVIQSSPRLTSVASPRIGAPPSRLQDQRPPDDEKDDGTVKKGCCCIVM